MLSGRDIILISSIEWGFNWQGHQEIASRLTDAGNRVLYVENMGVRSPRLRDAGRVVRRFSHWAGSLRDGGVRQVSPGLYVCSPAILPPFGSKTRQELNRRLLLPLILRTVRDLRLEPHVIWTFLPTDTVAALVRMMTKPGRVVVYYCIADFAELSPHRNEILGSERSIVKMSDIVFAQGPRLAARCSHGGKKAEIFPFGVNMGRFTNRDGHANGASGEDQSSSASRYSVSKFMSALSRPVIGYVGGIHKFFDAQMLAAMARARPDWSWVLVGPLQMSPQVLRRVPNVYLVGSKAHDELPDYISGFDVGIVPYISNRYTATVVPTKINEYLAMGKPVVSTDLPEVKAFNDKFGVITTSPNQAAEFVSSIERALLSAGGGADETRRRMVAAANDWGDRFERMSELVRLKLEKKE